MKIPRQMLRSLLDPNGILAIPILIFNGLSEDVACVYVCVTTRVLSFILSWLVRALLRLDEEKFRIFTLMRIHMQSEFVTLNTCNKPK